MTGLYVLFAAIGVPLVAWFLLAGDGSDGGADAGGADGGSGGFGGIMLRLFPLSTLAIAAASFGVSGLALGAVGTAAAVTLVWAVVIAVAAGALNTALFGYLRGSESGSSLRDDQLQGAIGRVVLPIAGSGRGRVAIAVGGQQLYLTASAMPADSARSLPDGAPAHDPAAELEVGAPILVIEVRDGVAHVIRLDPELT